MKNSNFSSHTLIRSLFTFLLIVLSFCLFAQKREYNKAVKENTVVGYKTFLINNPDSEYAQDVKKRLVELEFININKWMKESRPIYLSRHIEILEKALSGYKSFLARYPDSDHQEFVLNKIEEVEKNINELKEEEARKKQEKSKKRN